MNTYDLMELERVYEASNDLKAFKDIKMGKNINDASLQVDLITSDQIEGNRLPEVTSSLYMDKGEYDIGGLFSPVIFGSTQKERRTKFAYIDLGGEFFHPYVYEILCQLKHAHEDIARGMYSWKVVDQTFVKVSEDDPDYNENNTGLVWLMENIDKVKLGGRDSFLVNEKVNFINLTKDSWFINKFLVIPVFYRDMNMRSNGTPEIPRLNDLYARLISLSKALKRSGSDSVLATNNIRYQMMMTMVKIRQYGQSLYSKKSGFFRQSILGKNTDYSFRSVISTPMLNNCKHPDDAPIDCVTAGIPLTQLLGGGALFIQRYILEFFRKYFESMGIYYITKNTKGEIVKYELDDPLSYYNIDMIEKIMDNYVEDYECRFDPIEIPVKDAPNPVFMRAEGILYYEGQNELLSSTLNNRYLTWTDLFYMAAVDSLSDKHVYITRYPITSYLSIIPQRIHVLSTVKTMPVKFMDKTYPYYPVIDLKTSPEKLHTLFIDTITLSNTLLDQLGGDYDGDTVSARLVFTEEANEEVERLLHSNIHFMNMKNGLSKVIKNEIILSYHALSTY